MNSKSFFIGDIEKSIYDLLSSQNIGVYSQSSNEVAIYCLFHKNENSPALYINTRTGLWQCFNPACGKKGNFRQLYHHITGKKFGLDWILDPVNLQRELTNALLLYEEEDDELSIDSITIDYDSDKVDFLQILFDRGFNVQTLKDFEVGYSSVKDRVVVPVRDAQFKLVGLIGRAIHDWQEPKYLYNKGFKRANILFNIQNAKAFDSVIVCEGSLDALKIHQAGYKNVVATLGAKVSPNQITMLNKFFDSILIFSDADEAGDYMRRAILDGCRGKEVYTLCIPDGLKDPGDMTLEEIQHSIQNKKIHIGE